MSCLCLSSAHSPSFWSFLGFSFLLPQLQLREKEKDFSRLKSAWEEEKKTAEEKKGEVVEELNRQLALTQTQLAEARDSLKASVLLLLLPRPRRKKEKRRRSERRRRKERGKERKGHGDLEVVKDKTTYGLFF